MSRPRTVVAVTAVAMLVLAAVAFGGPLTRDRVPVAGTGAPPPFSERALVDVEAGQELCALDVVLTPRTAVAELALDQGRNPAPDLVFTARAAGYASPPVRIPGGTRGGHPVRATFVPPGREVLGRVCLRNTGERRARFVATNEFRTMARERTTVAGKEVPPDVVLTFLEARPVSLLSYLSRAVDHMTAFRGFLGAGWIVWPLLVLVAAGVPLALLWTLYRALRDEPV